MRYCLILRKKLPTIATARQAWVRVVEGKILSLTSGASADSRVVGEASLSNKQMIYSETFLEVKIHSKTFSTMTPS